MLYATELRGESWYASQESNLDPKLRRLVLSSIELEAHIWTMLSGEGRLTGLGAQAS